MNKIRTILVDDEVSSTEVFSIELKMYCPQVEVVAACNSAEEALEQVRLLKPDLVFLDIEMPFMNGFELLQSFDEIDFEVIFVTAYDAFAIRAFKFCAADYLLKPVQKEELISAVHNVVQNIVQRSKSDHFEALLSNINFLQCNIPKIALPTADGVEFVEIDNVLYCEADGSYVYVHLINGERILLSKSLKQLAELLDEQHFLRIHQSYLINLRHIKRYLRGQGGTVVLVNDRELPVSRARKDHLMDLLRMK